MPAEGLVVLKKENENYKRDRGIILDLEKKNKKQAGV